MKREEINKYCSGLFLMHLFDKNKSQLHCIYFLNFFFFSGKSTAHTVILCQGQQIRLRWRQGLMKRPHLRRARPFLRNEHVCMLSCPVMSDSFATHGLYPTRLFCPWFPRQEYWSGLSFPPPGDLPNPGTEPMSPASPVLQVDSLSLYRKGFPMRIL